MLGPGERMPEYAKNSGRVRRAPARARRSAPSRAADVGVSFEAYPEPVLPAAVQEALVAEAVDYIDAAFDSGLFAAARTRAAYYAGDVIWERLSADQ